MIRAEKVWVVSFQRDFLEFEKRLTFVAPNSKNLVCFTRCRLSASPATGLVGLQENSFLSDFFGCVGFLPLTTQRCRM